MRCLIVSPLSVLWQWKDEILKYSKIPKEGIFILHGTKDKKLKTLKEAMNRPGAICITNYESVIGEDLFALLAEWKPEIITLDESQKIKSNSSKRTKAIIKLGAYAEHRFILTGTMILNSVTDVFSQYQFLNPSIFGNNFYSFQAKFMFDANAGWKGKSNYFPNWQPRKDMYEELQRSIYQCAIRVTPEECIKDLPPLVTTKRVVEMSKEQSKMYKEMEKEFVTFIKNREGDLSPVEAQLAITKALRLQQIACGFVKDINEETIQIPGSNPRIAELKELLEEITLTEKVIIWTVFAATYKQIAKLCDELKLKYVFLTGEQSGEEKRDAMLSFQTNPDCKVIISNPSAGGTGTTLTAAKYAIYYSRNFSLGDFLQSQARNRRGGSGELHDTIFHIHITAKDSLDEHILEALSNKENVAKSVIDRIKHEG